MSEEARTWWEEPVPEELAGHAPYGGQPPYAGESPFGAMPGMEDGAPDAERERIVPTGAPRDDPEAAEIRDRVTEALKNVIDPELGMNIVDLGLVYGIDVYQDMVYITYTLTTMGCPIGPLIEAEMQRFLADIPGIERVEAEMVFRPPWTPEMMSEEAKAAMGFF